MKSSTTGSADLSRSVQKREAVQRGEKLPTFASPPAPQTETVTLDARELLTQVVYDAESCGGFICADLVVKIKKLLRSAETQR